MANNRFNRQVTPKGYQKGGSVKKSPMGSSSTKGNILHGKLKSQKELKKIQMKSTQLKVETLV